VPKTQSHASHSVRGHIVFVFALALALYLAWLVRGVLVLLYVSALFAVVLTPVVRATSRIHIGRGRPFQGSAAILVLLLAVAALLTVFGFLALPPVIHDLQSLSGQLPTQVPAFLARVREVPFLSRLNSGQVIAWIQGTAGKAVGSLLLSFKDWGGDLVQILAGFVLMLYFILEGEGAYRWFLSFLLPQPRQRLADTLERAAILMQKWLLGQLSLMLILGVASTIVYVSLGVRYAYALGVLTGLLNIVPVLGAAISVVLALIVAAIDSWGRVIGVAIFFFVYIQVENSWLIPRIMKSRLNLPSLAIFVALLLGAALEGILGVMVSIPTAVLVSVLLDEYFVKKSET
jgi:predicted PurR-regulated permease PerM